jgi:4-hydroxy-tetrahydrodipicolinate synthase
MGQNGRTNPVSLIKEAMKMVGYNAGIPRLPLSPGTEEEIAEVRKVMEKLQLV